MVGGRAAEAGKYPDELCRAICRGLLKEKRERTMDIRAVAEVVHHPRGRRDEEPDKEEHHVREEANMNMGEMRGTGGDKEGERALDDVTGLELDPDRVKEARKVEMEYVKKKHVWKKIPRKEALRRGWKIIRTKWVDVN